MNPDDLADARRIDDRRTADALQGRDDRDTGPAPALRGLGWGVLVAVVVAVVLFASVLVVEGRAREQPPAAPQGVVAAAPALPPSTPAPTPAAPTAPAPTPAGTDPADEGPAAGWDLDEGVGTVARDSAGGNDAVLEGGPRWGRGAVVLDGWSQWLEAPGPDLDPAGSWTLSARVRLDGERSYPAGVLSVRAGGRSPVKLGYQGTDFGGVFSVIARGPGGEEDIWALGRTNPQVGTWYHVAAVHDDVLGVVVLYVDGVEEARVPADPGPAGPVDVLIGADVDPGRDGVATAQWPGALDQVGVWESALPPARVRELAREG